MKQKPINKTKRTVQVSRSGVTRVTKSSELVGGNKKIGVMGETAACTYLKSKGHFLIGRNIRLKRGEIDILTVRNKTLHLVEVKTGLYADVIQPEDSFSAAKVARLKGLAGEVLSKYPSHPLFAALDMDEKAEKGLILRDNPAIQIDGVVVRIDMEKGRVKRVGVRYYPFLD